MDSEIRKKFYNTLGIYYRKFGYSKLCGIIEGIITLHDKRDWTQKELSSSIKQIFPNEAASISSVNRALKILESFGVIEKEGSHKIGYTYKMTSSSSYLLNMFEFFIKSNREYIESLESILRSMPKREDTILEETLSSHISACKILEDEYKKTLESLRSFFI
ncbi:MAG: hypothetical protein ACTSW1_14790 [Candidatus Hodarchaeales archaeon]